MLIRVLAAGLFLSVAPMTAAVAQTAPAATAAAFEARHLMIPAPDGRTIDISVWTAPEERGVIVFSSGFNSTPAAYHRILSEWVSHGYTIVVPLHVDSLQHPEHDKYDKTRAFATRIMDVAVARGVARSMAPGKPIIAAGHSFGSLISAIEGGAVTVAGAHGDPEVKGVIELSSPGIIQGLVTPTTYATLDKPLLVITGDKDVVPGFTTDWHDHRAAFDSSPRRSGAIMVTPKTC